MKKLLIFLLSMSSLALNSKNFTENGIRKEYDGQGTFYLEKKDKDGYLFMQLFTHTFEKAHFTPEGKITYCLERDSMTGLPRQTDNIKCEKFRHYFNEMLKLYQATLP